jgi:8-oxo-dGTP pyrophosphatase MutT (NUDIX family)
VILHEQGDTRFNFRVAGVAYRGERVLLQRVEGVTDYWFLPGGRVEMLESASQALVREVREELGVGVRVERLLWIVENFFELDGYRHHELGLYFAIGLPLEVVDDGEFAGQELDPAVFMRWFGLDELADLDLQPRFLRQALQHPPATPTHIVNRDQPSSTG